MSKTPSDGFSGLELWVADLGATARALDALETSQPRLAEADLKKIAASADAQTRQERRAAHIALRLLIERAWGPAWRGVPYELQGTGKPVLEGAPGSFNLAHVDKFALIGLSSEGAIGVDLEPPRPIQMADERRQRIERAAVALARGAPLPEEPEARFLQAWVRLEATAKADGSGIGRLLTGVGIIGDQGVNEERAAEISARFAVYDVPALGGCRAAVALSPGLRPPVPRQLPETAEALMRLIASSEAAISR